MRTTRGWSQELLARRLGEELGVEIDQSGIARIESGKRVVRLNEAQALCELLSFDVKLGRTTTKSQAEVLETALHDARRKGRTLITQFQEMAVRAQQMRNELTRVEGIIQDLHMQRAETEAVIRRLENDLYEVSDARKRAEMRERSDGE